jgi:hypothetical protein
MSSCSEIKNKDYSLPKECPQKNCTIIANSLSDIEEKFACRKMEDGKIIPQSWCRGCRKQGVKNK